MELDFPIKINLHRILPETTRRSNPFALGQSSPTSLRITHIVTKLKETAETYIYKTSSIYKTRPIIITAYLFFKHKSIEELVDVIVNGTPHQTQAILGLWDLLSSKRWNMGSIKFGVYLDIAQLKLAGNVPSAAFKDHFVERDGVGYEVGTYVGSSTDSSRGVSNRIRVHINKIQPRAEERKTAMQYDFAGRPAVHCDFFALCELEHTDDMAPHAPFTEGIFVAFFGGVYYSGEITAYRTPDVD